MRTRSCHVESAEPAPVVLNHINQTVIYLKIGPTAVPWFYFYLNAEETKYEVISSETIILLVQEKLIGFTFT